MRRFVGKCAGAIAGSEGAFFAFCAMGEPQTSALTLRQLNHRVLTVSDGAPADVTAIALLLRGRCGCRLPLGS